MSELEKINAILDKFEQKRGKIDLSLDRITAFLDKIGNPQQKIPPVIHFAGTNGKGSTIAFLKAMIEADGKSCHVYTSPHLVRFNERIALSGKDISDTLLLEILEQLDQEYEKHKAEIELTFFELTTIAAFMAFAKTPADYTLLETGLGGRFDATNLIPDPVLTVITPISIDHTEYLGNTLPEISFEKAGIIKQNITCISPPQVIEVSEVLQKAAQEKNANLIFSKNILTLPKLSLKGEHQKINASIAIAAAQFLQLSEAAINKGLITAKWLARMQLLTKGELVELLPPYFEIWLDGAHNLAGAQALATEIRNFERPVYLVIGMLNTKDVKSYLNVMKRVVRGIYTIPIPDQPNSFDPEELKNIAQSIGIDAFAMGSAEQAVNNIVDNYNPPAGIFICGSLYLAGHILKSNS